MLRNIGVSNAISQIILGDGITSMSILVNIYQEDIDGFEVYFKNINKSYVNANRPIRVSPLIIDRLMGVLFTFSVATEIVYNIPDFINVTMGMAQSFGRDYRWFKNSKSNEKDDDDLKLPQLEGHKNWIMFRDQFENKLSQTMGCKYSSLSYVIDTTPRPATSQRNPMSEVPYVSVTDLTILKSYAVHFGSSFKRDNNTVWSMIKSALLTTQPYNKVNICDNIKDGRRAWRMLKSHYEREDFVDAPIQENLAKIRSLFYHGVTPKFNFDKFVSTQMECYKRLSDVGYNNGKGVDDATIFTDLISSIMPGADLEVALSLARNKGIASSDYERLAQIFKAEVDNKNKRFRMWGKGRGKNISMVSTPGGRHSKYRGRGRGRGRGNGRTGKDKLILTKTIEGK
jgi:hypothetical protein